MNRMLSTFVAAGALTALGVPAFAQATANATVDLNIRAGAGPAYEVVGVIPAGEEVEVAGCLDPATWCEVTLGDTTGWASGGYLTAIVETTPVVIYENADAAGITTVTAGWLNANFRKSCAHEVMPASLAHAGTSRPLTCENSEPSLKLRFASTATPSFWAFVSFVGVTTCVRTSKSPRPLPRRCGTPLPRMT